MIGGNVFFDCQMGLHESVTRLFAFKVENKKTLLNELSGKIVCSV